METKIYWNNKRKEAYGLWENRFYQHVDGAEWVEVTTAKTPFRALEEDTFKSLFESFKRFINAKV